MDGNLIQILLSSFCYLLAALLAGLSGASVRLEKKRIPILLTILTGILSWFLTGFFLDIEFFFPTAYVGFMVIIFSAFRIPFIQALTVGIISFSFDLIFIRLLQFNILEMLLQYSEIEKDPFIISIISVFVSLNCLVAASYFYRFRPVLFSSSFFKKRKQEGAEEESFFTYLLVSLVILFLFNLFLYNLYVEREALPFVLRLSLTVGSLFLSMLFFTLLKNFLEKKKEEAQLYLEQKYQKELLNFFGVIRSQRHDFNFHLNSLYGLIRGNKFEDAQNYIEEIVQQVQSINELLMIQQPAISALLHTETEKASQKAITLHIQVYDDLREIPCSVYDMNKILGNLIQNAVEEVDLHIENGEERHVEVEISREYNQVVIKVANHIRVGEEDTLQNIFQAGYSTKEAHEGLGLFSVQQIVERYHGVFFPEIKGSMLIMNVRLPQS